MLRKTMLALALFLSANTMAGSQDPWLTMVVGVVCNSETALRKHFSLLPDIATKKDHLEVLSHDCKWQDIGIIYAVGEVNIISHGNRTLLFGSLSWPGQDKSAGFGIVKRPQYGSMTDT